MRLSDRSRISANETANETAAGAGGLTPASLARELLPRLTRGEPRRQSRSHRIKSVGAQAMSIDGITLSDREVRGERAHSRRYGRQADLLLDLIHGDRTRRSARGLHSRLASDSARGVRRIRLVCSQLAGRVVQAGLATGGDAYMTMAPPYEPADATVGVLLHHRLSVLRYHRADAHAAAWQAAGLTSEAMTQLPAGPVRAAIEAETNRRAGVPYATLSVDERVALLAGLAALPG